MSVTLFEPALTQLLDSQEGEVGQYVQRTAEAVVALAEIQFDEYFKGANLPAQQNVIFRMDGSTATVGYDATAGNQRKSKRIAKAEAEGKLVVPPIRNALEQISAGF